MTMPESRAPLARERTLTISPTEPGDALASEICPPCASAMSRAIDKPSPVPPVSRFSARRLCLDWAARALAPNRRIIKACEADQHHRR
jgi:hypothetical protein